MMNILGTGRLCETHGTYASLLLCCEI